MFGQLLLNKNKSYSAEQYFEEFPIWESKHGLIFSYLTIKLICQTSSTGHCKREWETIRHHNHLVYGVVPGKYTGQTRGLLSVDRLVPLVSDYDQCGKPAAHVGHV
jgi:hypothetical protein